MSSITVNNVELFFNEKGSGAPIIFVHGIPTDYRVWNSQVDYLSKKFRAIAYSRRYAFPNKREGNVLDSTIENNSNDLIGLIQELKLPQVHLVGHSFGGFVSMYTAWKRPELLKSLILIEPAIPSVLVKNENSQMQKLFFFLRNPSAAMSAHRFQTGLLMKSLKAFESGDLRGAVKCFYDGIKEMPGAFEKAPPEIQSIMIDNGRTVGELETEFPIFTSSDARKISLPTLLVKGENSPKWLQAIVDRLSKSVPNSKAVKISGSGHLPHIENPSELNSRLQEFLENRIESGLGGT